MKSKVSYKLLNIFVLTGIILTLLALAAVPAVLTAFFKSSEFATDNPNVVLMLSIGIYACAAPFTAALAELKKICSLLGLEETFSMKIPKHFNNIAICALAEAVIFLASQAVVSIFFKAYMYALTVIPCIVVPFICATAGLLSLVFAGIFKKAAEIKEENDLTF